MAGFAMMRFTSPGAGEPGALPKPWGCGAAGSELQTRGQPQPELFLSWVAAAWLLSGLHGEQ